MTQRQENILSMWNTAEAVLSANEGVWKTLNAFTALVDRFRSLHLEIDPSARRQQKATIGIALDKQVLRNNLTTQVSQLAANLQAFAAITKNNTLLGQVSFSPSHFDRLRDNMLPVMIRLLLEQVEAHKAALPDYGVNETMLEQIKQALSQYESMNAAPRVAIGNRKAAGTDIMRQISEGNLQLELMDKLLGNFNSSHPEFVAAFRNARMIINVGNHKLKANKDKDKV